MGTKPDKPETRGRKARGDVAGTPITVRLTPKEHAGYLKGAKAAGLSLAEWIRAACAAFLKR